MDMPAFSLTSVPVTDELERALGVRPLEAYLCRDLICVLDKEQEVRDLCPDMELLKGLEGQMVSVSSLGGECD